eukprot:CAMPEP_0204909362 /NCGR_PEP_ID=MMETSP1397-20131031/8106_1 /ASSEMBLY_ACC=CAM_ASM_000891 /TAXON_ID=49980 /ORGANISM="Climacostomum Climacostomum virens, Strain Stock W-24" /LENGTH=322 /DNA_ID=CAMNT_0052079177 /DNA_START=59 /DNA_END=1027 /DNA_ORIENTATION=-
MQLFAGFWITFKAIALRSNHINVFFFEFFIDLGASVILIAATLLVLGRRALFKVPRKFWLKLLLCGVFGVNNAQMFFNLGNMFGGPALTCIGMLLVPMCVFSLSFFVGPEKLHIVKCAGIALAFIGATTMLLAVYEYSMAELFLICHALSAAFNVIILRTLTQGQGALHPLVVATHSYVIGSCCMLVVSYATSATFIPFSLSEGLKGLDKLCVTLYLNQIGNALTSVMMAWAASKGAVTMAAMYISSRPIFTYFIALSYDYSKYGFFQDHLYIYIIMIVVGFGIAFTGKKLEQVERKKQVKIAAEQKYRANREKLKDYTPLP